VMRTPSRAVSRLAWAGLVSLAGLTLSAAPASAALPAEQTLPGSTLALVKVDNTAALREAFERSQFGQMLADPAMTPLKDDLRGKLEGRNAQLKQRFGLTFAELLDLPQGPSWLAVVGRDNAQPPVAVLLSVDAGPNRPQMQELLDRAAKEAEAAGRKVVTEPFQGGTIHLIDPPQDPDPAPLSLRAWTSQEGLFTFASDVEALKDVVAHAQGRTDSLAAGETFGTVRERVGRDAQLVWFVDLGQVFRRLAQGADAQGGDAQQFEAMLQLLGITSLKAVGGGFSFNADDFDSVSRVYIHAPGPAQGLIGLFPMPQASLRPQPWIPAAVASYWSISWDLDRAYGALKDLTNQLAPNFLEQFEKDLAGPGAAPLSFHKDVFGPLGDRVTVVSDFKKPVSEQSQRVLLAVELEDAAAFQNTLNKLIKLGGAAPKQREFQGQTIYDFDIEVPQAGAASGLKGPISVAIAQQHAFAATDPSLLEQVLRGGGPALADSPNFQDVARQVPDRVSTLSYAQPEEQARLLYEMVKTGQLQKALEGANMVGGPDVPKVDVLIDPEKLPEFSVFAKYLSPGGGFSLMDETGATLTRFTLRKTTNP
jgi:Protein of unknown function (DUF3352)